MFKVFLPEAREILGQDGSIVVLETQISYDRRDLKNALPGQLLSSAQSSDGKKLVLVLDSSRHLVHGTATDVLEPIACRSLRAVGCGSVFVPGGRGEKCRHRALSGRIKEQIPNAGVTADVTPEGEKVVISRLFVGLVQVILHIR